jgi:hypothetical protein
MSVADSVRTVKSNPTAHHQRLIDAQRTGAVVTVRFVAGRTHHTRHATTGTVDGFIRRPREAEKVLIAQSDSLVRWEVPLRDIFAIETPIQKGARL